MDQLRKDRNRSDYEMHTAAPVRWLLIAIGWVTLVLGIIGAFLPIVPTTPFVLITAACFARSSPRFYRMLMTNRYVGPYLRAWRDEHRIPRHAKILATIMILLTLTPSVVLFIPLLAIKVLVAGIGIAVIAYIWHFPS